jgi:large subunit ribosomal protein L25
VAVPVHFENDGISPGIKRGAVLNVVRHAVEVYCDADNIPEQFTADLGPLDFNDNVRWHDLKGTENVKPVIDRDFVVATVVPPTKIEVVAEAGAAGAPSAAAPAKGGSKAPAKAAAKKG